MIELIEHARWEISVQKTPDGELVRRYILLPEKFNKGSFPTRINIFWKFSNCDDKGLPSVLEDKAALEFENLLVAILGRSNTAVLSLVITGRCEREFVFYTSSVSDFALQLELLDDGSLPYPISLFSATDEAWNYYDFEVQQSETRH